tara:strand:+ start:491 stop:907 length:417 start_codon:yes stop_codon:yes gene_type:complete
MLVYQVVQPFSYQISGDNLNNAIKNFVKYHRDLNLTSIIIADQNRHIEAKFNYMFSEGKNKVQIKRYPYYGPVNMGPPFFQWYETLPGATGIPITPAMPITTTPSFLFSPTIPYTPVPILTDPYIPTIIEFKTVETKD